MLLKLHIWLQNLRLETLEGGESNAATSLWIAWVKLVPIGLEALRTILNRANLLGACGLCTSEVAEGNKIDIML